jgi:hypothetical protein
MKFFKKSFTRVDAALKLLVFLKYRMPQVLHPASGTLLSELQHRGTGSDLNLLKLFV